ncbi:T9SS type B sorting domain-containing protein [Aquimarina brevivitae]|uniref:Gliding motility-associated-like protein n=1 Tax=Aquimarina brevivitae TaxID=323412 RepID=A0A4Q7PIK4_9FLAO|nr:T9SS type B sorting domain-containing protein [Aquimarina brevivitae]RZT00088.1 gliding motility-associated-like protein [Aquimarina brevivitae]
MFPLFYDRSRPNCSILLIYIGLLILPVFAYAQGSVCFDPSGENGAEPFCSSTGIVFPNCHNGDASCTTSAEVGPDYGCLGSQPFPAWYFLQIEESGDLEFNIVQTSNEDGTGSQLDVDFICYGPFNDPTTPCASDLTSANTVDCSFSASFNEIMNINNAQEGEYYLVLITNFSQSQGFISFQQINGNGATDCSILEATLGPNQNICGNGPIELDGETEEAIRYEWSIFNETTGNFEVIAGETTSILSVDVTGRYQLLVEDASGNIETDEVLITFNTPPVVDQQPNNLTLCEEAGGTAVFDFSQNTQRILGPQDQTEYSVTYYVSQADAESDLNAIAEQFASGPTNIFARITNNNLPSCFEITSFILEVNPAPNLSFSEFGYTICEPLDNTPDQAFITVDEVAVSLLSPTGEPVDLLANDEPLQLSNFDVRYYSSVQDAVQDVNPFVNGDTVIDGQSIFIRVENSNTSCFNIDDIAEVIINVAQIPEANPNIENFVACATDISEPSRSVFNLRDKDFEVLGINDPTANSIAYYRTIEDYTNDLNLSEEELVAFRNTTNPQQIFAAVIDDQNGCGKSNVVSFELQVNELPTLTDNESFSGEQVVCVNPDGSVQQPLQIGEDLGALDGNIYLYDWTPDNTDQNNDGLEDAIFQIQSLPESQEFSLVITRLGSNGEPDCTNAINPFTSEEYAITLRPSAAPLRVGYVIEESSFSSSFTITAQPEFQVGELQDYEYAINNGSFQDSPTFTDLPAGDYVITVRNRNGCQPLVESELIQTLGYPKYFTPNGDNIHDTWSLINAEDQSTALIYIFDRNGKLLKQIFPGGSGWNGTFNGKLMPSGEYWFSVEFNEPADPNNHRKVFKGSFSLIR